MLSFAIVWSLYLAFPSTTLIIVGVRGLLLTRLASAVRLRITNSVDEVCPAMRMQGTAAPWLTVSIVQWRKQRSGSRQLLLHLAVMSSLCCVETANASPAFLTISSFSVSHKELTPYHASVPRCRFSTSPKLFFSLPVAASPFAANKFNRNYAVSVTKRWRTPMFAAPDPSTRAQVKSSVCLTSGVEGHISRFNATNIKYQFESFSRAYHRCRSRDAVSADLGAHTQLPGSRLFSSFTEKIALTPPFRVSRECAHLESAVWPGVRRAFGSTITATAQTGPETLEKDAPLLGALKRLRSVTGCSIVACKEALESSKGDIHAAIDWLRRKGLAVTGGAAANASSIQQRQQTEGVIAIASWRASPNHETRSSRQKHGGNEAAAGRSSTRTHEGEVALKLSCSTDFVARNTRITQFARRAAVLLANHLQRVGLQKMLVTRTAATALSEDLDERRAGSASAARRGQQPLSESLLDPTQRAGETVVLQGAPLVEKLLNLPWSSGEEASGGADGAATAEKALFRAGNFFQEQQQLAGASTQQKKCQPVQMSEKEERMAQEHTKREQLATKGAVSKPALKKTRSTIGEELQYLSTIVKEPLSISDAVAIEAPVDSGVVASYVHGIIDKQVGTLAVLAALAVDHEKDGGAQTNQQPTRRSPPATVEALQGRRSSQVLHSEQQQIQWQETWQKHRKGNSQRTSETSPPQQRLAEQDAPQQRTEVPSRSATSCGLRERLRTLAESICMQIAAGRPVAVDERSLGRDLLEREERIFRAQAEATGKPSATVERMVTGKVNKWLKEVLLLRQTWLLDDSGVTVQQKLSEFAVQQQMKKVPRIEAFIKIQVH